MPKSLLKIVLLSTTSALATTCHLTYAQGLPAPTGGYVSSVAPIYPSQEQQTGAMWKTTEIIMCPDGYQLELDPQSSAPTCVSIALQSGNGGR